MKKAVGKAVVGVLVTIGVFYAFVLFTAWF